VIQVREGNELELSVVMQRPHDVREGGGIGPSRQGNDNARGWGRELFPLKRPPDLVVQEH